MAYTALAYFVFMMRMDAKVTLTDGTDYGHNIKLQFLRNQTRHGLACSHAPGLIKALCMI